MIRVFFLIRSLEVGGAERQLFEIVRGLDKETFDVTVATFYDGGELRHEMEGVERVRLLTLGKKGRWDLFPFLRNLWAAVRRGRPDILFGYMSPANELGWAMGRMVGARVVWALRSSDVNFSYYDWMPAFLYRLGALLSGRADLIIANSIAGKRSHGDSGYSTDRMMVIHNGIDTTAYRPDREASLRLRSEWNIRADEKLIGIAGRLDPMKDHPTFLRAAAILSRERPRCRFVCVGGGPEPYARKLRDLGESLGLDVLWAGARKDMPAIYNALDLACCSSDSGEGFPNVVAEAMACSVPCVATDVGDLSLLVGDTGVIVPPGDPLAFAAGMRTLIDRLEAGEEECRRLARRRIVSEFGVDRVVERTAAALGRVLAGE